MNPDDIRRRRDSLRRQSLDDARHLKPTKYLAKHTVAAEETLSHIALKYYGHATKPYYMVIYEANKSAIGNDPNRVKPGLELNIPELPEDLKDK
jgi:nucleoid-associated protein YgaU